MLDPLNPAEIILGTCRVWRGPASGAGWTHSNLLSGMLDGDQGPVCNGNAEIRSMAAAPVTDDPSQPPGSERIYAGMAGFLDGGSLKPGHLFAAAVANDSQAPDAAWTDLYYSPVTNHPASEFQFNPGGFDVSSIYADPHDATGQTVYATVQAISQRSGGQAVLYRSSDAGGHWLDIGANLPDAPANSIVVDPHDARVVYVALDTGVYFTNDVAACSAANAACWNVLGSGLPNAPVTQLKTFSQGAIQLLRASTYGRGLWQVPLVSSGLLRTTVTVSPLALTFAAQQAETIKIGRAHV